jgi:hypothetical protein
LTIDPVTKSTMRSVHLLATGVLLTSHGLTCTTALGWRDRGRHATVGVIAEEAGSSGYYERDDASMTELGE